MNRFLFLLLFGVYLSCGHEQKESNGAPVSQEEEDNYIDVKDTTSVKEDDAFHSAFPENYIEFGFSNEEGTALKLVNDPTAKDPQKFVHTINNIDGSVTSISYEGKDTGTVNDTHRQTPYNFKDSPGHRYSVNGAVDPWKGAVLMTAGFVRDCEWGNVINDMKPVLTDEKIEQIESIKTDWEFDSYEPIAIYDNLYDAYFVNFKPRGDSVMVSLLFTSPYGGMTFLDFPANYNEISTWRVDDGGVFDYDSFTILACLIRNGTLEIITSWAGAEGCSMNYYYSDGTGHFVPLKRGYLYQAPL